MRFIAYEGPSMIDGSPIVLLVKTHTTNRKTGDLAQTYVLRADVSPWAAVKSGADASICGSCKLRPAVASPGAPKCYVASGAWRGPGRVWDAYKRGGYARASVGDIAAALTGRTVRLGTYGDPFAVPVQVWRAILASAAGHTGYSHQWARPDFDVAAWAPLVMASVDSVEEAQSATHAGMRYFRVSIGPDKRAGEAVCPASAEAGKRSTCADCRLCGGTSVRAKNIVIQDHGPGYAARARRVIPMALAV